MVPRMPNGYATAYPRPTSCVASAPAPPSASACCAAPMPGVLVTAPDNRPTSVGSGTWNSAARPSANAVPPTTMPTASRFSARPCRRSDEKKPPPSCNPVAYTKRMSPNSRTNSMVCWSSARPRCPSSSPAKSTPPIPRLMPRTRTLPSASPPAMTRDSVSTEWATVGSRKSATIQSMGHPEAIRRPYTPPRGAVKGAGATDPTRPSRAAPSRWPWPSRTGRRSRSWPRGSGGTGRARAARSAGGACRRPGAPWRSDRARRW